MTLNDPILIKLCQIGGNTNYINYITLIHGIEDSIAEVFPFCSKRESY